jgi:hypothetical protein
MFTIVEAFLFSASPAESSLASILTHPSAREKPFFWQRSHRERWYNNLPYRYFSADGEPFA